MLAAVVIALHFAAIQVFSAGETRQRPAPAPALVTTAFVIPALDDAGVVSRSITLSSPRLIRPTVHIDPPHVQITEDSSSSRIPLFTMARPDASESSRDPLVETASLGAGKTVTIVLRIEVRPDGSVGKVSAEDGSIAPELLAEAIAHARKMRWIPATALGAPTVIVIRYPVVMFGAPS